MSLYNSTLPEYREIELNTAALALIQEFALSAVPTTAQISLSSLSFGQEPYLLTHGSPGLHEYYRSPDNYCRHFHIFPHVRRQFSSSKRR